MKREQVAPGCGSESKVVSKESICGQIRNLDSLSPILRKLAATGHSMFAWKYTKAYLGMKLRVKFCEMLKEKGWYDPEGTYKKKLLQILTKLNSFESDPPFTIQRLAEILLEPSIIATHKAMNGIHKVLNVESTTDGDGTFLEQHDTDFLLTSNEEGGTNDWRVGTKRKELDAGEGSIVKRLRPDEVEQPEPVWPPYSSLLLLGQKILQVTNEY